MEKTMASQDPGPGGQGHKPQGLAAPGLMGEAPSKGSEKPSLGKWVRFYADVHRRGENGEGYRITYTADGATFRHVDSFLDIPANVGDKVFVDVLPLHHTDGAIELLKRGVEVYYLRRTTLIARRRDQLKLSKSAKSDIKVLMSIEERWFRRVTEEFLVMRRLISAYRPLLKVHVQLLNKRKALPRDDGNLLEPAITSIEEQMRVLATEISEEAGKRYPAYNRVVDELEIRGNASAMEALAEIIPYIDGRGFTKTANLFGLFKPVRGSVKIYNGRLRQALQRLTVSANRIGPLQLTARFEKETLHRVWKTVREETQGRLVIPAQG